MPPRTPGRHAPLSVFDKAHFIAGEAENIMHDTAATGAVGDVANLRAMSVIVDDAVKGAQWKHAIAIVTIHLQGQKRGSVF
jgi:hypothetical protein